MSTGILLLLLTCFMVAMGDDQPESNWPDYIQGEIFEEAMSRMSSCSNRKCRVYFRGWWATMCSPGTRQLFFCQTTNKFCCARACRIQPQCVVLGGHCLSNKFRCSGTVYSSLCKGRRCVCCVPDQSSTTTGTAGNETATTTITITEPAGPTLAPCPITGLPGVACNYPESCAFITQRVAGGIYDICPYSNCPAMTVKCMGDWTVILYRNTLAMPRCDFARSWDEYKTGFCSAPNEYWLGNEALHVLTKYSPYQMQMYGLSSSSDFRMLHYDSFSVDDEASNYTLSVSGFNPTMSNGIDLFISPPTDNFILTGMPFSTHDRDNDNFGGGNCSAEYMANGGWWFNDCSAIKATHNSFIDWYFWNGSSNYTQERLQSFYIRIRPN